MTQTSEIKGQEQHGGRGRIFGEPERIFGGTAGVGSRSRGR